MRGLTFTLNMQTGDDGMAPAKITITEQLDGSLSFSISNDADSDNMIADIRALFFDVSDDDLIGTLTVDGDDVSGVEQSVDGDLTSVGSNSNSINGVGSENPDHDGSYEVAIDFGTQGIANDDIQSTTFTLSSSLRDLTLDDIALESFTVRQQSVGEEGGSREDSDKLFGESPYPVNAIDDDVVVDEDQTETGNVFANDIDEDAGDADNDGIPDDLEVTAVDGDAGQVGQAIELDDGVTIIVNADGSYTVDATDADYLSVGETLEHTVEYSVDDGNGGSDTATINVTVNGVNDDPTALNDTNATDEDTAVTGNVLINDSDIDRLDSIEVSAVNGDSAAVGQTIILDSGASLTLNADGSYSYDPSGAFDELSVGENETDSFTYEISDGNGGFDTATVEITIEGANDNPEAGNDDIVTDEDAIAHGNVLDNDSDIDRLDTLTVSAVNGDAAQVGQTIELADGITVVVNADGSYSLDAEDADYLSAGEVYTDTLSYTVDDGNGGTDTATINVTVNGVNDDPTAMNDVNATDEDTTVTGNVLDNDSDIDRLDTIEVSAVNGDAGAVGSQITLDSGALLTLNADGTYSYDPNDAFDHLNTGESAVDTFTYEIADGNGGFDTATVEITIDGIGEPVDEDHFGTFTNKKGVEQEISNVVLYLSDGDDITKVKIDGWDGGETDLDDVDLDAFLDAEFADYELIAASIKVGNNHNKDLGPGEGQLFLLDGDEDIDYEQGGDVPEGLTEEILGAKADVTYEYSEDLFA